MILIIDNYDSFTHNLVDLVRQKCLVEFRVVRNDELSLDELIDLSPERILLSPGPGRPEAAGICPKLVDHFLGLRPILGICLGHQVLAQALGARIEQISEPVHGKSSQVVHDGSGVFRDVRSPMTVMRYHSLRVRRDSLPSGLRVSSWVDGQENEVMGIRCSDALAEGLQFHPESFLTPHGPRLIHNFLAANGIS